MGSHSSGVGRLSNPSPEPFNGVKVFSATMVAEREKLGEKVTAWLDANPKIRVRDVHVTQSSDEAFHCVAITVFYYEDLS